MGWVQASDRLPITGARVTCRLRHCDSENVVEHELVKVDEDDCAWRTADDCSEISYSWDVVEWYEESIQPAPPA